MERYTSPRISLRTILKWQISKRFASAPADEAPTAVDYRDALPEGEYAMWLGHATLWLNMGGTTVAIDPVFGGIPMYGRHTPLPLPRERLLADLILITHAHYDHFDKRSVLELLRRNPETIIVAPQGFWRYLKNDIARERCFELEWWESLMVGGLFITLVPALHWSKRTPFDTNKALWGGYVIQNSDHTLYHAGDTGYGEHFGEIAERFAISEAFLPIGAYRPEAIMRPNHLNPPEALQAFRDLGARTFIPIHYGTFRLSDEPLDEPLAWFTELVKREGTADAARILAIGEVYRFNTTSTFKST